MKRLTLALLAISLLLVAPRPHNLTDRPPKNDRPKAADDYREDNLTCAEDFCQDFEYTGGCDVEHGWPWKQYAVTANAPDCGWEGDGVTSGTNAFRVFDGTQWFRMFDVIDTSATGILYSQFSIRITSATEAYFHAFYNAKFGSQDIEPWLKAKGSTSEFQLWCDVVGSSVSSTFTYTEDVDYVIRLKSDTDHPVTEQAEIYNTSMTLLDTLTCASDGLQFFDPNGFEAGNVDGVPVGTMVFDDIRLDDVAF